MAHLTVLTGASRGLGAAMASRLLGTDGVLLCISRGTHPALEKEARASGAQLTQWQLDLEDGRIAAHRLVEWLGSQNANQLSSATLINNAAMIPQVAPLQDVPDMQLQAALRIGLEAPMQLTRAFLAATQAWVCPRRILNISSGLGRYPMASQAAYCAVKAGMDHFSRCVALEEAAQVNGARICSIAPGVIDTDMQLQLRSTPTAQFADVSRFQALHAQGQLASPDATAQALLNFLEHPLFGTQAVADIRDSLPD
ncbi:MAG: short-chain dehydrogenase [Burkholderiales bacterium PBB4]|nr:MAG: short-chain dehydrogenase [Burkholderiales bacterium PBB4]